ncbi:hypothetical protein [Candidatus Skiveiella danica]|uniref:hypothetical protein n=1 Tax=Candidatus Skiveiella danica TaxID=3386177 RepID=UPI0039B86E32
MIDHFAVFFGVPLQVVHAQAVDHQQHPGRCSGQMRRARLDVPAQCLPWWRSVMEMASGLPLATRWSPMTPFRMASTVSRCAARLRGAGGFEQRHQPGERHVQRLAHGLRDAVDALADQAGHPARLPVAGPPGTPMVS